MKKNLALFMAAMMAMTAVPVTSVFASTEVSVGIADYYAKEQDTAYDGGAETEAISYYLDIVLDDYVAKDSQFVAELTGAKFTNLAGDARNVSYFDDEDDTTSENPVWFAGGKDDVYSSTVVKLDPSTGGYVSDSAGANTSMKTLVTAFNAAKTAATKAVTTAVAAEPIAFAPLAGFPEDVDAALVGLDAAIAVAVNNNATYFETHFKGLSYTKAQLVALRAKLVALQAIVTPLLTQMDNLATQITNLEEDNGITSTSVISATFAFANAGETEDGRVLWTNTENVGTKGDYSADEGDVIVKKTGDRTMRATFTKALNADDGDNQITVRIPLPITIDADAKSVEIAVTDSSGEVPVKSFMLVDTASAGTVTSSDGIAKGREIIKLKTILIKEATTAVFNDGSFELTAPDGYRFRNKISDIKITDDGDASFSVNTGTTGKTIPAIEWTDDDDNTSFAVALDVNQSSRLPGTIKVEGLEIEPIDDETIVDGEELFMTISDYTEDEEDADTDYGFAPSDNSDDDSFYDGNDLDGIGVDKEEFKVADSVNWGVTLTAASVKDLTAGRWDKDVDADVHATAEITIEETEDDTWRATRTTQFTLPEGVEIRGVNIKSVDGFSTTATATTDGAIRNEQFDVTDDDISGDITDTAADLGMDSKFAAVTDTNFESGVVSIDENVMTWKNLDLRDDEVSKVTFVLYLSIAPTYAEDTIELQLGGTAIDDEIDPVTIANVKHPITVTTKPTDVQIGYQRFTVADIVIEENFAGAILEADNGLVISMDNDSNRSYGIELVEAGDVTVEGDIRISDQNKSTNQIAFDVIKASSKTPSTITLSDVEVYVDRTVPYGTYEVEVGGESVFANVEGGAIDNNKDDVDAAEASYDAVHGAGKWDDQVAKFARFSDGYKTEYINLATEGANTPLKDHVVISAGSATALVDGKEITMTDVVPYRTDAEGNSFMVPVRFASEIFGVKSENLLWDNASKTATILLDGGRIIQFVGGTDYYTVNGAKVQMLTGTTPVYTEIDPAAERMYVPFRHLGRAFGIADADITYDEATETAQYNQPRE